MCTMNVGEETFIEITEISYYYETNLLFQVEDCYIS
jgi:hypothetical protein